MERPSLSITNIEAIPLRIPFRQALTESVGRYEEITPVLLKLHTDAGVTGIGEVESYPLFERDGVEPQAGVLAILRSHLIPLLVGADPFQRVGAQGRGPRPAPRRGAPPPHTEGGGGRGPDQDRREPRL